MSITVDRRIIELYSNYVNAFNEAIDAHHDKLADLIDETLDEDMQGILMAIQIIFRGDVVEARSDFNSGLYQLVASPPPTYQNIGQIPTQSHAEVDALLAEMTGLINEPNNPC